MLANALVCATVPRSTCGQELIDGFLDLLLKVPAWSLPTSSTQTSRP
jgi:hypothetical protein